MIVSSLIYIRKDGKTLMIRQERNVDGMKYIYNGVGGKLEKAETPEMCAVREIKEETGLTANQLEFRGYITFPNFETDVDWLVFLYECYDFDGEIVESNEGTLHWIDDDEILSLDMWAGDYKFLDIVYNSDDIFYGESFYDNGKYLSSSFKRIKKAK